MIVSCYQYPENVQPVAQECISIACTLSLVLLGDRDLLLFVHVSRGVHGSADLPVPKN